MARFAIARLASTDLVYVPEPPVFVDLTASILQQADGDLAGTDSVLSTIAGFVGNEADAGPSFDNDLAGMSFNPGDFQSSTFDPINYDYAAFVPGTEGLLVANEGGLGINPAPGGGAPGPTTPPGGPGGGTGATPTDPCAAQNQLPLSAPCSSFSGTPVVHSFVYHALHKGCPDWQDRLGTSILLGSQAGRVPEPIITNAVLVQGDASILTPSVEQSNPQTQFWFSVLVNTFHPVKLGHFEFLVRYLSTSSGVSYLVSICIDIVA
jgi:hypothetical protein